MDFEIPEELKMVQSLVKDFVTDQLKPLERDILGRAADLSDAQMFLPEDTEAKLVKMAQDMRWSEHLGQLSGGGRAGSDGYPL